MTPHELLVSHLQKLLYLAEHNEFHDFQNSTYATPKMELVKQLEAIINNVKNGLYDN